MGYLGFSRFLTAARRFAPAASRVFRIEFRAKDAEDAKRKCSKGEILKFLCVLCELCASLLESNPGSHSPREASADYSDGHRLKISLAPLSLSPGKWCQKRVGKPTTDFSTRYIYITCCFTGRSWRSPEASSNFYRGFSRMERMARIDVLKAVRLV